MSPDELLTHLDDLVLHLAGDHQPTGRFQPTGETGATCLCTVYDPVSRRFAPASAGHPLPLIIFPDGTRVPVAAQLGPPLGIGGLPFEATEFQLPKGGLLALYTDGLVTSRDRDIDEGVAQPQQMVTHSVTSLEAVCDTAMDAMLCASRTDDAALLLARTHALHPQHVATGTSSRTPRRCRTPGNSPSTRWRPEGWRTWPSSPSWSPASWSPTPSGTPTPRLRTCAGPRAFDEGGRGLLLVAQLTQGWDIRHTTNGKTICCARSPSPSLSRSRTAAVAAVRLRACSGSGCCESQSVTCRSCRARPRPGRAVGRRSRRCSPGR
ncbi:ATP-binding SpoIIE family protein phosphatase [Streptomyces sp. NPDC002324]